MDRKNTKELQEHMMGTYYGLRAGLAVIGIALPLVVLFAGGILHDAGLKPSISQYYHPNKEALSYFTTRDFFVGGLFAAAACLYLYKGFSTRENVALNLAGVFALFVALLPTAAADSDEGIVSTLHKTSAVLFFLCIAYVSLFRSRDTLLLLPPAKRMRYARGYLCTGLAMIASPLVAVALSFWLERSSGIRTLIFWVEAFGVWTFAAYWIIKTVEMRVTNAEKRALVAELKREIVSATSSEADAVGAQSAEVEAVVSAESERMPNTVTEATKIYR